MLEKRSKRFLRFPFDFFPTAQKIEAFLFLAHAKMEGKNGGEIIKKKCKQFLSF